MQSGTRRTTKSGTRRTMQSGTRRTPWERQAPAWPHPAAHTPDRNTLRLSTFHFQLSTSPGPDHGALPQSGTRRTSWERQAPAWPYHHGAHPKRNTAHQAERIALSPCPLVSSSVYDHGATCKAEDGAPCKADRLVPLSSCLLSVRQRVEQHCFRQTQRRQRLISDKRFRVGSSTR